MSSTEIQQKNELTHAPVPPWYARATRVLVRGCWTGTKNATKKIWAFLPGKSKAAKIAWGILLSPFKVIATIAVAGTMLGAYALGSVAITTGMCIREGILGGLKNMTWDVLKGPNRIWSFFKGLGKIILGTAGLTAITLGVSTVVGAPLAPLLAGAVSSAASAVAPVTLSAGGLPTMSVGTFIAPVLSGIATSVTVLGAGGAITALGVSVIVSNIATLTNKEELDNYYQSSLSSTDTESTDVSATSAELSEKLSQTHKNSHALREHVEGGKNLDPQHQQQSSSHSAENVSEDNKTPQDSIQPSNDRHIPHR